VAGDAALLVDPLSVDALSLTLTRLLADQDLAEDLGRRGREQASRFTWQATASQTAAVYRQALGRPPAPPAGGEPA